MMSPGLAARLLGTNEFCPYFPAVTVCIVISPEVVAEPFWAKAESPAAQSAQNENIGCCIL